MKQYPREDLARLAIYVVSARIAGGYATRKDFAAAIGVTARTLGKLETGTERVSAETLARVAKGLHWTPDSPARVMSGLEPRTVPVAVPAPAPLPTADSSDEEVARFIASRPDDRDDLERLWRMPGGDGRLLPRERRLLLVLAWVMNSPEPLRAQAAGLSCALTFP